MNKQEAIELIEQMDEPKEDEMCLILECVVSNG